MHRANPIFVLNPTKININDAFNQIGFNCLAFRINSQKNIGLPSSMVPLAESVKKRIPINAKAIPMDTKKDTSTLPLKLPHYG